MEQKTGIGLVNATFAGELAQNPVRTIILTAIVVMNWRFIQAAEGHKDRVSPSLSQESNLKGSYSGFLFR